MVEIYSNQNPTKLKVAPNVYLEGLQKMSSKDENRLMVRKMLRKHLTIN